MSYELEFVATGVDEENDDDPPPIAGLADLAKWIPGAKTAVSAMNSLTDDGNVRNAVDFTNKQITTAAAFKALLTGGSSFLLTMQMHPIAMSSFKVIAEKDDLWNQYCKELSKTNYFVRCGYVWGKALRAKIRSLKERENGTSVGV